MFLSVIGMNHKTAPVSLREIVSIEPESVPRLLEEMLDRGAFEAALLSTCNRTEVYAVAGSAAEARRVALQTFMTLDDGKDATRGLLAQSYYHYANVDAALHLFTVASGLDSLVVGEAQVLGQVKTAYRQAVKAGTAGPVISQLFSQSVRVGKRTRTETRIGEGAVSISFAAVELARRTLGTLSGKKVLVVGAGKMAELAAKNMADQGAPAILVANRTRAHSVTLADAVGGEAVGLDQVAALLAEVDIVLSSTGARTPVITHSAVSRAMDQRKQRPLFIIDIAVPRDVEPSVCELQGVHLYNIDDLKAVVEANMLERAEHVGDAARIVDDEAKRFDAWLKSRVAAPVIRALRQKVSETTEAEVARVLRRLEHLPERERDQVRALARTIAGKILHHPTVRLKSSVEEGTHTQVFDSISDLFGLELDELRSGRANGGTA